MQRPYRIVIGSEDTRRRALDVLALLSLEKHPWAITIQPHRRNRSLEQNNLLWMWYGIIAQETGNDAEDIHEFCKQKFLPPVFVDINGEVREARRSTTKLKVDEMSAFMGAVLAWATGGLGVLLPLPEERAA